MAHVYGRQIAAARALIGMSQAELAAAARISVPTLKRMEASNGRASGMANNLQAVVTALESGGIRFETSSDEIGVTTSVFQRELDV